MGTKEQGMGRSLPGMSAVPLLPAFYFGTAEHYALLARAGSGVIETGGHYLRQSYRNRSTIVGPNGRQELIVPIARRSGEKMPLGSVGLSHDEPWPSRHLQAIRTAYGQTPWFIHYLPDLEEMYAQRWRKLVDLDLASMHLVLRWLRLKVNVEVRDVFVEDLHGLADHRTDLHPKKPLPAGIPPLPPWPQAFQERHGFSGRLSVLDLLMNTGPDARDLLQRA
jgi:hypothetical protein